MVSKINTVAFQGIDVVDVDVQVQIAGGLPTFTIVGLPDKAVAESRERVSAAWGALGLALAPKRIIINLAPADLLKEGSHFDLPIALGLLAAMGVLPADEIAGHVALGDSTPHQHSFGRSLHFRYGSQAEVQCGPRNVRSWGQSRRKNAR